MRNNLSNLSAETSEVYILGSRVKSVLTTNVGVTTTYFVGAHYEVSNGIITKYYYAGSQRIAIRENNVLSYIIGDHLGSNSIVTDSSGNVISNTKYKAWGEVRYSSGSNPSEYTYTGQYSYVSDFGLMFYNARWYDSSLSRFAQADTIVPDPYNSQGWDRFAYTLNNPILYNDPNGHVPSCTPGVRCPFQIPSDRRDVGKWLVVASVDIAESSEMQSVKTANSEWRFDDAATEFISLVGDDAIYDVKKVMFEEFAGSPIKIGDNWYEYSTAGNVIYGFYGTEVGYSPLALYAGAGGAQIEDWWEGDTDDLGIFLGDTSDDHYAVMFGIYLYDNYYANDGELTYSDLLDALAEYPYSDWMAIVDPPKGYQPRDYEYRANAFYNRPPNNNIRME